MQQRFKAIQLGSVYDIRGHKLSNRKACYIYLILFMICFKTDKNVDVLHIAVEYVVVWSTGKLKNIQHEEF